MTLSEKEKASIILEESTNDFNECQKQLNETGKAFLECKRALNSANTYLKMVLNVAIDVVDKYIKFTNTYLKMVLNEEDNDGNIHKDCKYYDSEKDYCRNYMMGRYTGLAFEVSRHKKCIDDLRKDGDV